MAELFVKMCNGLSMMKLNELFTLDDYIKGTRGHSWKLAATGAWLTNRTGTSTAGQTGRSAILARFFQTK